MKLEKTTRTTQAAKSANIDRDTYLWSDTELSYRLGQTDRNGYPLRSDQMPYARRADGSVYNMYTMTEDDWAEYRELLKEGERRGILAPLRYVYNDSEAL